MMDDIRSMRRSAALLRDGADNRGDAADNLERGAAEIERLRTIMEQIDSLGFAMGMTEVKRLARAALVSNGQGNGLAATNQTKETE